MTFTEIQTEVKDRLGVSSTDASTRIGRLINQVYRDVTTSVGINPSRQYQANTTATIGSTYVTFSGAEKVLRVWIEDSDGNVTVLMPVVLGELQKESPETSDDVTRWALYSHTSNSVRIKLDVVAETAFNIYADVITEVADLSGAQEPAFPESFHDMIVAGVLAKEYRRKSDRDLAREEEMTFEKRLSELRLFIAKNSLLKIQQRGAKSPAGAVTAVGGAGSATLGQTAYTQTGLITFDRGSAVVPFAIDDADAAYVPNLGAEFIGAVATDRLIGRDTAGTGESEQLTVGGGLEFTGSGGVQTSAFTGDVTKAAGGTAQTIPAGTVTLAKMANLATDKLIGRDTAGTGVPEALGVTNGLEFTGTGNIGVADNGVTYARMQNVSAASKLLGRGSAGGAGDPEEISLGTGLSMSATTVNVLGGLIVEGRLTLTSGTPVTTADVSGATAVYFTPYGRGNRIALYDGTNWLIRTFAELTLDISGWTASSVYDVFAYDNAGTVAIEGLIWTNATTRATALTTQDGVLVKTGATTRRYLGSVYVNASGGQTDDTAAKRYLWNYYNRVDRPMAVNEGTDSWTYTTATIRQANGATGNQLDFVIGWSEDAVEANVYVTAQNSSVNVAIAAGIGLDSTTANASGARMMPAATYIVDKKVGLHAQYRGFPGVGRHRLVWLEFSAATGTTTWFGDDAGPTVTQSGITGLIRG